MLRCRLHHATEAARKQGHSSRPSRMENNCAATRGQITAQREHGIKQVRVFKYLIFCKFCASIDLCSGYATETVREDSAIPLDLAAMFVPSPGSGASVPVGDKSLHRDTTETSLNMHCVENQAAADDQ
ncbi:hypothetical protein NDU88_003000 [Pleurodeles waltl]|uniref:Uncharacterized protein n=1 Tax=Pleurodeles waltl TaxID=8319 RepID=A0AAV7TMU8_PLEWA|nr:hypothetical protein NDU88_003000 [Pleurodeles waltl]